MASKTAAVPEYQKSHFVRTFGVSKRQLANYLRAYTQDDGTVNHRAALKLAGMLEHGYEMRKVYY